MFKGPNIFELLPACTKKHIVEELCKAFFFSFMIRLKLSTMLKFLDYMKGLKEGLAPSTATPCLYCEILWATI